MPLNSLCPDAMPFFDEYLAHVERGNLQGGEFPQDAAINLQFTWSRASKKKDTFDDMFAGYASPCRFAYFKARKEMEFRVDLLLNNRRWACPSSSPIVFPVHPFDAQKPASGVITVNVKTGKVKVRIPGLSSVTAVAQHEPVTQVQPFIPAKIMYAVTGLDVLALSFTKGQQDSLGGSLIKP